MEGLVALMGKLHLDPQAGVIDVLERALLLVGKPRSDLCDARYDMYAIGQTPPFEAIGRMCIVHIKPFLFYASTS